MISWEKLVIPWSSFNTGSEIYWLRNTAEVIFWPPDQDLALFFTFDLVALELRSWDVIWLWCCSGVAEHNPLTGSVLTYLQMIAGEVRGAFRTPEIRISPQVVGQLSRWFCCNIILFMNLIIKEIFSPICSVWAIAFGVRTCGRDVKELSALLEIGKKNWIEIYCLPLLGVSAAKVGNSIIGASQGPNTKVCFQSKNQMS